MRVTKAGFLDLGWRGQVRPPKRFFRAPGRFRRFRRESFGGQPGSHILRPFDFVGMPVARLFEFELRLQGSNQAGTNLVLTPGQHNPRGEKVLFGFEEINS